MLSYVGVFWSFHLGMSKNCWVKSSIQGSKLGVLLLNGPYKKSDIYYVKNLPCTPTFLSPLQALKKMPTLPFLMVVALYIH